MDWARTPLYGALALYGFYVTLHLAVGAVITLAGSPGPVGGTAAPKASAVPVPVGMPHVCDCEDAADPSDCALGGSEAPQRDPPDPGDSDCAPVRSEPVETAGTQHAAAHD
jgi:hypothetical protein